MGIGMVGEFEIMEKGIPVNSKFARIMSAVPFRFKEFELQQDRCAMKVGTDGVLLGAWASIEGAKTILDIGTGTGLIALMCAQRNEQAQILGLELDTDAAQQASENAQLSSWSDRVRIVQGDFREINFPVSSFDHIVSNPPFFEGSQLSGDAARDRARHTAALSLADLAAGCSKLLAPNGKVSLVLPMDRLKKAEEVFERSGLFLIRQTTVFGRAGAPAKRGLLEFSPVNKMLKETQLTIEITRHEYTPEYITLTKAFYFNM